MMMPRLISADITADTIVITQTKLTAEIEKKEKVKPTRG